MADQTPRPGIRTIPSSDVAFEAIVAQIAAEGGFRTPRDLGERLRRLFPRVLVRDRALTGERPVWYVYRDGAWRPNEDAPWWTQPGLPRFVVAPDGSITKANALARGLLGIPVRDRRRLHFSHFVEPANQPDAAALFEIVKSGHELLATVVMRPLDGNVIACDLRAARENDELVGVFRLAAGIEVAPGTGHRPVSLVTLPPSDTVFRQFADDVLTNMPEPTPAAFELVVRKLYPHAHVERRANDTWELHRDGRQDRASAEHEWWTDRSLPRLRYDAQGLILEANEAATQFLGRPLVGHHWHEFVTPTATDVVTPVLEIIRKAGVAISRFRMPAGDGSLVEFDSYTTADGETLTTVMRPT
jgi:PAS domain-containing protein